MKMLSINRIQGRIATNPQIQAYQEFRLTDRDGWKWQEYQWNFDGHRYKSPFSNAIYTNAHNVIDGFCRLPGQRRIDIATRRYEHYAIKAQNWAIADDINAYLILEARFDGVFLTWSIDGAPRHEMRVRSRDTFHGLDMSAYFERHILPTLYHPVGMFRDIQLRFKIDKQAAVAKWHELYSNAKQARPLSEDTVERATLRRLRRHYKLIADRYWPVDRLIQMATAYGKQRRKTWIEEQPSHHWFNTFDGDIDELESEFWSEYERTRPTIFA